MVEKRERGKGGSDTDRGRGRGRKRYERDEKVGVGVGLVYIRATTLVSFVSSRSLCVSFLLMDEDTVSDV